ncbi:MAG TPA: LptF/LptG family permease [Opitutaceae bacterium]
MNTFDRHLLREWLQILEVVLAALLGLLLVQICYEDLRSMLDAGAHLPEMARYVVLTLPSFFADVLPLALLISLLFTLGKLHRANELTAMRAAGVGFARLMAPIWVVGALACGAVWWLNSTLVPASVVQSESFRNEIEYRKEAKALAADKVGASYDVAFDEPRAGRMWFINRFSRGTGHGYGVSVTETHGTPFASRQIWAAEAWPDADGTGWTFERGRLVTFDPDTGEQKGSDPFKRWNEPAFHEDPNLMLLLRERVDDLSIFDTQRVMDYFAIQNPPQAVPYTIRYYSIIAETLGPLIVILIAIPFAVTGVRVNPAVGVAKSMGLFCIYYLLEALCGGAANKGLLDPQLAAWLPNVAMGGIGIWLFARIR